MVATTTITTLADGKKRKLIHVVIVSDGAELTDSVVYDYSGDTEIPADRVAGGVKIMQAWFENPAAAGQIFVEFDGSTDALACGCGVGDSHHSDYRSCGGLKNNASTPTGDITITTLGFAAGEQSAVTLEICKN